MRLGPFPPENRSPFLSPPAPRLRLPHLDPPPTSTAILRSAKLTWQNTCAIGAGANLKSANGTYWGLYNAASEYFNYERGDQEDIRLKSLWFGSSAKMNEHALDTAMKMSQQMAMVVA